MKINLTRRRKKLDIKMEKKKKKTGNKTWACRSVHNGTKEMWNMLYKENVLQCSIGCVALLLLSWDRVTAFIRLSWFACLAYYLPSQCFLSTLYNVHIKNKIYGRGMGAALTQTWRLFNDHKWKQLDRIQANRKKMEHNCYEVIGMLRQNCQFKI